MWDLECENSKLLQLNVRMGVWMKGRVSEIQMCSWPGKKHVMSPCRKFLSFCYSDELGEVRGWFKHLGHSA